MNNPIYKTLVIAPAALIVFYLSMVGGFNLFNTVLAWTNPSATPPTESLVPIPVSDGGTGASSAASARADLGTAASGANSDITSLSPSGNLIISPTGGVGIGTTSLISGATVTVNGNLVTTGELQSTLASGDGQIRMIAGNYGAMWRNDGTNTWFLLTASGSQYGSWNSLRPMQISDSSGEVYMANGLDITSGGITFPDGTVQTTAAGGSVANGSQSWTTPGTYTWTVPAGVTRIEAAIWGAGGGGGPGGAGVPNTGSGTGGQSGGLSVVFISVSPGQSITVAVGAGGTSGNSGGSSSVGSVIIPGVGAGTSSNTSPGLINVPPTAGGAGWGGDNTYCGGGGGGASGLGGLGQIGQSCNGNVAGGTGAGGPANPGGYGAGGAGGAIGPGGTSSSYDGGNGGNGATPGGGGGGGGSGYQVYNGFQSGAPGGSGGTGGNGQVFIFW